MAGRRFLYQETPEHATVINKKLLSTGDYSDITLVCEGQEFRVHKNIVCTQSPVLAAAMRGPFKEAQTNTFQVTDFNPATVKCMLSYMYTGDYTTSLGCPEENNSRGSRRGHIENDSTKDISDSWIQHGLVNCIADYFCLPELAKKATTALNNLICKNWSADAFCDLLSGTQGRTGDSKFRTMLATRAADHIGELVAKDLFNGTGPGDDIALAVLRECAQKIRAETTRADGHAKNIEALTKFVSESTSFKCESCGRFVTCSVKRVRVPSNSYEVCCSSCRKVKFKSG